MSKILVFGHQIPDTDSIASAISLAKLQKKLGRNAEAVCLGNINEETKYALNYFRLIPPRIIKKVGTELTDVMMVDHNEFQQSVSDISKMNILAVIDHHRISNFKTEKPLFYRSEPVGSTSTIILKLYKESKIPLSLPIAGIMLSAIISDTLLFKSPTSTIEDEIAAKELARIAKVEINSYGIEMIKSGTTIVNKSAKQLLNFDAKTFFMGDKTIRIAQINITNLNDISEKQRELELEMESIIVKYKYDLFVLMATSVLQGDSEILVVGNARRNVEKAFNISLMNNRAFLKNIVSRKKQIVPYLAETFN